jgi:hypothetical protein
MISITLAVIWIVTIGLAAFFLGGGIGVRAGYMKALEDMEKKIARHMKKLMPDAKGKK